MKITVMGPGGVGGYFGARLAAAGNDVTFVARGSHLAAMRKGGLRLDSDIGKLHLSPAQVVADAGEIAAADAIIFAVKLGDTENAALREKYGSMLLEFSRHYGVLGLAIKQRDRAENALKLFEKLRDQNPHAALLNSLEI